MNNINSKCLSLSECDKILNRVDKKYSKEELEEIRDFIYNLNLIIMEFHKSAE